MCCRQKTHHAGATLNFEANPAMQHVSKHCHCVDAKHRPEDSGKEELVLQQVLQETVEGCMRCGLLPQLPTFQVACLVASNENWLPYYSSQPPPQRHVHTLPFM